MDCQYGLADFNQTQTTTTHNTPTR